MKFTVFSCIANRKEHGVEMSRLSLTAIFGLVFLLVSAGCTRSTGIIRLNTEPAKYYVDGIEKGITPAEFEWDVERPIMLEIRKEGFHTEQELLNGAWLKYQMSKGHFGKVRVGKVTKEWTIVIDRKLKAAPSGVASGTAEQ